MCGVDSGVDVDVILTDFFVCFLAVRSKIFIFLEVLIGLFSTTKKN
jgi:hypothetical protein